MSFGQSAGAAAAARGAVTLDSDNVITVSRYDLKVAIAKNNLAKFKGEVDSVIGQLAGKPVSGRQVEYGGLPGYEYAIELGKPANGLSRMAVLFDRATEYLINCQSTPPKRDTVERSLPQGARHPGDQVACARSAEPLRLALRIALGLVLAWIAFAAVLFLWPPQHVPAHADAVVVLAGARGPRLARGLELVQRRVAPVLVVSDGWGVAWAEANRLCAGRRAPAHGRLRPPLALLDPRRGGGDRPAGERARLAVRARRHVAVPPRPRGDPLRPLPRRGRWRRTAPASRSRRGSGPPRSRRQSSPTRYTRSGC